MPGKRLFIKGHREHGETLLFAHWEKKRWTKQTAPRGGHRRIVDAIHTS